MKTCFRCQRRKPIRAFYRHPGTADGRLGKCKTCTKKDVAARAAAHPERLAAYERLRWKDPARRDAVYQSIKRGRRAHPGRTKAYVAVYRALKSGLLVRGPCEACGSTKKVEAHHDDYRRPLVVRWLCRRHHLESHGKRGSS